jgi:hypothetical protein
VQSVGNGQYGAMSKMLSNGVLNPCVSLGIDGSGRFIQDQNA